MECSINKNAEDAVRAGICNLISAFQENPYRFLYESDLQAYLSNAIANQLDKPIIVSSGVYPDRKYELSPVNTEYFSRIDVAVLDAEMCSNYPARVHAGIDAHLYELPVLYGIEMKYRKQGDSFGIERCENDMRKLLQLRQNRGSPYKPMCYGFIQDERDVEDFFSTREMSKTRKIVKKERQLDGMVIVTPSRCWAIDYVNIVWDDLEQ